MNILHLSDIHFGRDHCGIQEKFDKKEKILDQLLNTLASIDESEIPHVVLVTGDIAWHGEQAEFDEAYKWFQKLREVLKLDPDQIVFCPGNHDLNRKTAINFREEQLLDKNGSVDVGKCDVFYTYEKAHLMESRFYNYNCFCEKMGMQPYSYLLKNGEREYSYLVGSSTFLLSGQEYTISCFNTAYLPYGTVLRDDQMFIGLPQVESLIENGVLPEEDNSAYHIAMFHHADRYLHPNEQCEYNGRKATLTLLLNHTDLALCGHTETGGLPIARKYQTGGWLLAGGAAYYNDEHPNSFSLINVQKGKDPVVNSFYYHIEREEWCRFERETFLPWERSSDKPVWNDAVKDKEYLLFGTYIDGKMKDIYCGYFDKTIATIDGTEAVLLSNRINPARAIDIWTLPSKGNVIGIKHAPAQWKRTDSLLLLAEYNIFMRDSIQGAKFAGNVYWDPSNMSPQHWAPLDIKRTEKEYKGKASNIGFYQKLKKIEKAFDIRFLLPDKQATQDEIEIVQWVDEIVEDGFLKLEINGCEGGTFNVHNLKEIEWTRRVGQQNGNIVFYYRRRLKIPLFLADVDLGECEIYFEGITIADQAEVERKFSTWEEGDVRAIGINISDPLSIQIRPRMFAPNAAAFVKQGKYVIEMPEQAPLICNDYLSSYIKEYNQSSGLLPQ